MQTTGHDVEVHATNLAVAQGDREGRRMTVPVWVAPSARDHTRTYMMAQLSARGIDEVWETSIPKVRPARFFTIEELNSTTEFRLIAEAQMIQIRAYNSTGGRWLYDTMRLIKGLWAVMPSELIVQSVEHAGGPSYDEDPDVPGLRYGQLIAWVTVMTQLV